MAAQHGFLFIADITGYTVYLSGSELEHAHDVLRRLLTLLIDSTRPPLQVSSLQGDAVLSYAISGDLLKPQTFIEIIESTYVNFRQAIELMVLNNRCQCRACANIGALDLKFFLHAGSFIVQEMDGRPDLLGPEVILIHRLLKNHVTEITGLSAYTLYTQAAVDAVGLDAPAAGLLRHSETYEHLGDVTVWIQDLAPIWRDYQQYAPPALAPDDVNITATADFGMPPHVLWDYLADETFRNILIGSDRQEVTNMQGGRVAPGTVYQCYHGDHALPLTIVQWRPFEQFTTESETPVRGTSLLVEYRLAPNDGGTCLTQSFGRARGSMPGRVLIDFMFRRSRRQAQADMEKFRRAVDDDYVARAKAPMSPSPNTTTIEDAVKESLRDLPTS